MTNLPTVYRSIIAPLLSLLKTEARQLPKDNYTLSLCHFTLNLCYCVISGTRSIRLLTTKIRSLKDAAKLELVSVSPSMYSEAFSRYDPAIFRRLFLGLLDTLSLKSIPEIDALGRFILMDGSIFPAIKSMAWACYKKTANGIKLHLAFELNRMIPVQFISTEANGSEKESLRNLLEKGVTYIADRGYIAFDLFSQIADQSAFFVIRVKSNMDCTVQEKLTVHLPENWLHHLTNVTDNQVVFAGDKCKKLYRLITFDALGESYRIATNRLDLKTYEIIMLYAYRWQIELFFRCMKRCFNGLHLWTHEPKGVEIQFYIYMIVYLLLLNFKQDTHESFNEYSSLSEDQKANCITDNLESENRETLKNNHSRTPASGIVTILGEKLKGIWKIGIHWLTALRNQLTSPLNIETIRLLNST
jgi:hypothetical protein